MSQTQRCIVCSESRMDNPLWEDEVCAACGRCIDHCTAPHVLSFDPRARDKENRPHADAGRVITLDEFTPAPEDSDRARAPV